MKRYIRADSSKPVLDTVYTVWEEYEGGSGIKFSIYSEDDELLFESVYDYQDVDPDQVFDSAVELAIISLSQQYELTETAINTIKEEGPQDE